MANTWFSSDFHLGHKNILKYDNRPFTTIQEHDETIIKNCLSLMKKGDSFYFLGDLCLGRISIAEDFLYTLLMNGINTFFIKGNHDNSNIIKLYKRYGVYLGYMDEIKIDGQQITLCHYGMRVWNKSHHGSWHLYGHSHGSLPEHNKSFDVGINIWDYKPISFQQIKEKMDTLIFTPVDHHNSNTNL